MKLWERFTELTIVKKLRLGKNAVIAITNADGTESTVSLGEQAVLDGVTAGTVTASKAVVVDSNKDVGDFRNLDAVNIDAGASGTAGSVDVFPATAARGKLNFAAANSAGDTTTTITNASQAGARTYTVPDAGASASFVMTEGAQTVNGVKTFGSVPVLPAGGLTAGATTLAETDLAKIGGITNGTQAAGKAVVADANVNTGISKITELHIGASGSETQVTATAAELNDSDLSARTQAITEAGAINLDARHVTLTTGAGYAVTLAAPTRAGITKVIECLDGTNNVTLALTNVIGGTAATTATFNAANETLVLVSSGNKWVVTAEAGVTLS